MSTEHCLISGRFHQPTCTSRHSQPHLLQPLAATNLLSFCMDQANELYTIPSLGQEEPLEKGMATHSSTLAWRIPQTEEPIVLQSMGLQSWTRLSD